MIVQIATLVFIAFCAASTFGEPQTMPATQPTSGPPTISVMTFNLRYSTAPDGDNHWDKRKGILLDTIRHSSPDLLGTQECLAEQFDYLKVQLPGYEIIGVGRDDGVRAGEFSAVLYRRDRFEKIDSGTFWLSEHPEIVGVKGWDAALPRIATWVKLRDRFSARELIFLNTHFDHVGIQARIYSASLIRRWIDENAKGLPAVVAGDFNGMPDSKEYAAMTSFVIGGVNLLDTYRAAQKPSPDERTFHAFNGDVKGQRIDYIFCTDHFIPVEAAIIRFSKDGRYPSDHFPVTATLRWR